MSLWTSYYNLSGVCLSVCLFVPLLLRGPLTDLRQTWWVYVGGPRNCPWGVLFEKVNGSTGQTSLFRSSRLCRPQRVHFRVLFWKRQRGQRVKGVKSQFFGAPDSVGLDGYTLLVVMKKVQSIKFPFKIWLNTWGECTIARCIHFMSEQVLHWWQ